MARQATRVADVPGDTVMVGDGSGGGSGVEIVDDGNDAHEGEHEDVEVELENPPEARTRSKESDIEDEDEDTRLAYDDPGEGGEGERTSRRQRRNQARRERLNGANQQVEFLKGQVDQLGGLVAHLARSQMGQSLQSVENELGQAQNAIRLADEAIAKAVADGDGDTFKKAQAIRDEAASRALELGGIRRNLQERARQVGPLPPVVPPGQRQSQNEEVHPNAAHYGEIFMERFPWFDPQGTDEDSAIVRAIDDTVAREGFVPSTREYWSQIERRLKARGYAPEASQDGDVENDEPPARQGRPAPRRVAQEAPARARGGLPPTGAVRSTSAPGRTVFALSKDQIDILRGEGLMEKTLSMDDIAKKNRIVGKWRDGAAALKSGQVR